MTVAQEVFGVVEWKPLWLAREQTGKELLAFDQRLAPQIPPVEVQKVESE